MAKWIEVLFGADFWGLKEHCIGQESDHLMARGDSMQPLPDYFFQLLFCIARPGQLVLIDYGQCVSIRLIQMLVFNLCIVDKHSIIASFLYCPGGRRSRHIHEKVLCELFHNNSFIL